MPEIKAVALDVDGVLTDGTFWWGLDGSELKRFSFRDIMGIARAMRGGLLVALISGEQNALVDRYAAKLKITNVFQGCKDKEAALRSFAESQQLQLENICFMGDDVNDLAAMKIAGFSSAPADAHEAAIAAATYVTKRPGGRGAVRELLEFLNLVQQ
ncbi:MAG: 3-deoxy-D-manno-octulosonate 8-phosphate phosphatase phosphatase [Verrucomicrobiota bacterium]|jgi:3-deoxy-D-manno-octulosonate 8-phosphate phosphatase (KDO 8-P phosphatase)